MMAFMPHRDVIVAFRVKFTKIVPTKIFCASPPGGQEDTLSDTLIRRYLAPSPWNALVAPQASRLTSTP